MEPIRQRPSIPSTSEQKATPQLVSYTDLLIDGDYVAKLRSFYQNDFDGLVLGEPKAFDVSLGFENGEWTLSPGAQVALTSNEVWVATLRHGCGNWGEVGQETADANFRALQYGGELRAAYHTLGGIRFIITTNAERTRTTIQLEQEPQP